MTKILKRMIKFVKHYFAVSEKSVGSVATSKELFTRSSPKLKDTPIIVRADLSKNDSCKIEEKDMSKREQ